MKDKTRIISLCAVIIAAISLSCVALTGCGDKDPYPLADGELLHEPVLTHTYDETSRSLSFTCVCETCGADFLPVIEIGVYKEDEFIRLYELGNGNTMDLKDYESGAAYTFVPYNSYMDRYMSKFEIRME